MFTRRPKEKPDEPKAGSDPNNGSKEKQTNPARKGGDGKYQHSENHPKFFQKGGRLMYQPVMSEENVRRLYYLKLEKRKPMTKAVGPDP